MNFMKFLEILFLKDIRIVNGGNIMQCSCGREMTDRFSVSPKYRSLAPWGGVYTY